MSDGQSERKQQQQHIPKSMRVARARRRATLTEHGRLVEDLIDEFGRALESDDVQGFFERTAARIMHADKE